MRNTCEECGGKEDLIRIKELDESGKIKFKHLCRECAQRKGIIMERENLIARLKEFMNEITEADEELFCKNCGLKFAEFKITGRLGCEFCYTYFTDEIKKMFSLIGEDFKYQGEEYSEKGNFKIWREKILNYLNKKMNKLVEEENYEAAARLRDIVKEIEKKDEGNI